MMQAQEPTPFIPCRISMNTRHAVEKDMARTAKMAWEQKKTNTKGSRTYTQGPEHHQPVPNQYKEGGPMVKRFRGCGLVVGRKVVYFEVPVEPSFGENALLGWHFALKRQAKGYDHSMHAIRVGRRRAFNPYPFE